MWDQLKKIDHHFRDKFDEEHLKFMKDNENYCKLYFEATDKDIRLRSVALDDPEQGLSSDNLDWVDVII